MVFINFTRSPSLPDKNRKYLYAVDLLEAKYSLEPPPPNLVLIFTLLVFIELFQVFCVKPPNKMTLNNSASKYMCYCVFVFKNYFDILGNLFHFSILKA